MCRIYYFFLDILTFQHLQLLHFIENCNRHDIRCFVKNNNVHFQNVVVIAFLVFELLLSNYVECKKTFRKITKFVIIRIYKKML